MNYLMLDLFLCFDLISIIRNPFGSKKKSFQICNHKSFYGSCQRNHIYEDKRSWFNLLSFRDGILLNCFELECIILCIPSLLQWIIQIGSVARAEAPCFLDFFFHLNQLLPYVP